MRVDEPARYPAGTLVLRPAVIRAGANEIDLVVLVFPVLHPEERAGPGLEGEALRVPVTERVRGRPRGRTREDRVVARDRPVAVQAQHFAVERVRILREPPLARLAHRRPELAVGSEDEAAAVVDRRGAHSLPDDVAVERHAARLEPETEDLVQIGRASC